MWGVTDPNTPPGDALLLAASGLQRMQICGTAESAALALVSEKRP
jgi:hypothetical protein